LIPAAARPRVVHQAGARHIEALQAAYDKAGVAAACMAFIVDIAARYAERRRSLPRRRDHCLRARRGGVGSMIVPLPGAIADEQSANAQFLVDGDAAVKISERSSRPRRSRAPAIVHARDTARDGDRCAQARAARRCGSRRRHLHRAGNIVMKHKVKRVHFRRHRRRGHERDCRSARHTGLSRVRLRSCREQGHARLASLGIKVATGHATGQRRRCRRRRRIDRGGCRQPKSPRRANAEYRSCRAR
jgi:hypothetical protein